jgi:hypothetical protein
MKNFERTKWADHKFTPDEKKAQAIWRRAQKQFYELTDTLKTSPDHRDREYLHSRLDYVLDNIKRTENAAKEMFPEVAESFSVAVMEL